jgi:hypothetical protein
MAARRPVVLKIAINNRDFKQARECRDLLGAGEAGLDGARRGAAVAVAEVAVVAGFVRELLAVAADRLAGAVDADRIEGAGRRAAVVGGDVRVVALLGALLFPSPHVVFRQPAASQA